MNVLCQYNVGASSNIVGLTTSGSNDLINTVGGPQATKGNGTTVYAQNFVFNNNQNISAGGWSSL